MMHWSDHRPRPYREGKKWYWECKCGERWKCKGKKDAYMQAQEHRVKVFKEWEEWHKDIIEPEEEE